MTNKEVNGLERRLMTDNINDFVDEVLCGLRDKHADTRFEFREVIKNNGCVFHGISMLKEDSALTPTVYLDEDFKMYREGGNLDNITDRIYEILKNSLPNSIDTSIISDYEKAKEHICFKLINTEKNKEMLEDTPNEPFLDLSMVFFVDLSESETSVSTVLIRDSILEMWGKTAQEIKEAALKNTKEQMPELITPIADMIATLRGLKPEEIPVFPVNEMPLVLTNRRKTYGAAAVLYDDVLKDISEKYDDDLYILPSSVHEVILVGRSMCSDENVLLEMVKDVNNSVVLPDEVLSDNIYMYSKESGKISLKFKL